MGTIKRNLKEIKNISLRQYYRLSCVNESTVLWYMAEEPRESRYLSHRKVLFFKVSGYPLRRTNVL